MKEQEFITKQNWEDLSIPCLSLFSWYSKIRDIYKKAQLNGNS